MPYTLWSHGRLLGHTDLDIRTVSANMRQGFVEPTDEGRRVLPDATGVFRAIADERRAKREGRAEDAAGAFLQACARREALDLELRDEEGRLFECAFMRVYDLRDDSLDEDDPFEDEFDGEPLDSELEAAIAHDLEILSERFDAPQWSAPWPGPDPRWETMQYHLQVFLTLEAPDDVFSG